jgi:uncharacterized protein
MSAFFVPGYVQELYMTALLLYLVVGAASGTLAGLFGIGGGTVIVPVVIFALTAQGVSPEVLTHIAVATSLTTIVFTSISSVRTHHQKGAIDWRLVGLMTAGIVFGTALGSVVVADVPGPVLQKIIGVFAILLSLQMFFALQPKRGENPVRAAKDVAAGGVIGFASSWFGIGGGSFMVPYLTWRGEDMRRAVATSSACGFPIALTGSVSNMLTGWGDPLLPAWSTGFIFWPAVIGIGIASVPFARVGAHLAHKLDQKVLKKAFALLLLLVGIKFLTM